MALNTTQEMKFSIKDSFSKCMVTFTEEILNENLYLFGSRKFILCVHIRRSRLVFGHDVFLFITYLLLLLHVSVKIKLVWCRLSNLCTVMQICNFLPTIWFLICNWYTSRNGGTSLKKQFWQNNWRYATYFRKMLQLYFKWDYQKEI